MLLKRLVVREASRAVSSGCGGRSCFVPGAGIGIKSRVILIFFLHRRLVFPTRTRHDEPYYHPNDSWHKISPNNHTDRASESKKHKNLFKRSSMKLWELYYHYTHVNKLCSYNIHTYVRACISRRYTAATHQ